MLLVPKGLGHDLRNGDKQSLFCCSSKKNVLPAASAIKVYKRNMNLELIHTKQGPLDVDTLLSIKKIKLGLKICLTNDSREIVPGIISEVFY